MNRLRELDNDRRAAAAGRTPASGLNATPRTSARGPAPVSAVHNGRADVGHAAPVNPFRQPKAVYAVAFACVVSFMGIGLVDPILPALSKQLKASPSRSSCCSPAISW